MVEMPKTIWAGRYLENGIFQSFWRICDFLYPDSRGKTMAYIQKQIADELAEALEDLLIPVVEPGKTAFESRDTLRARAALERYREVK